MGNSNDSGGEKPEHSQSTKPYLVRAIYDWALDNGFTPQVLVATNTEGVQVPRQYIKDNQIVLNIHPKSVTGLELGNEFLWCSARFSGTAMEITAPMPAVLAIYARENGQGIVFQDEDSGVPPPSDPDRDREEGSATVNEPRQGSAPHLKVVK
jgi:stringent starvation protein B